MQHIGRSIFFAGSSPTVKDCAFYDNHAMLGGAVYAREAFTQFINCTFVNNAANYGSGILAYDNSQITLEYCILASNQGGIPVYCLENSIASLTCSDVFGNASGDWTGCLAGQEGINGNFSADPLFCNVAIGDVGLIDESSTCLPDNNDCEVLIGALGVGCICNCGVGGDMDCDEEADPLDVTRLVNYVYLSRDTRCHRPIYPFPVGDLDCNEGVNPLDVAYLVNAVYKSQNAICDGCAP